MIAQPAPAPLPSALVRDLVKALQEAATDGRPLSTAWVNAVAELERVVGKRPEGDSDRIFLQGLRAAALGKAGERDWAQAARTLQVALRSQGAGTAEALRLWGHLADLQAAQGLPDYPWRDRALALRLDRSRGVDEALEGALLASLKDHWGGFLEPPRRELTLARCHDLAGLWLRRPQQDRARIMGRTAFEEHAGALWAFAAREGDEALRDRLHECLRDLPPKPLLAGLEERPFLAWVKDLKESPLTHEVQALVLALNPLVEARWGFQARLDLLREAGLFPTYLEVLTEGLDRLPPEGRRRLLKRDLLALPKLSPDLSKRIQERLAEEAADPALRSAWAERFQALGLDAEAAALQGPGEPEGGKGKEEKAAQEDRADLGIFGSEVEAVLLPAFQSGRMDEVEAVLWPLLERLARGEMAVLPKADELSALPGVVVEPWLRRRAPDEAAVRLERLESLLLRAGTPLPVEFTGAVPGLRRKVERQRRLMLLLGAAVEP